MIDTMMILAIKCTCVELCSLQGTDRDTHSRYLHFYHTFDTSGGETRLACTCEHVCILFYAYTHALTRGQWGEVNGCCRTVFIRRRLIIAN